ncbi:MAG TPA: hypothetical protein VNS32_17360 [Flavisolibacter sp.]|nr:hypothetical protein [Flavisolibacter sp.]
MKIATYPFVRRPESYYYEFYSEGPNGRIKKVVEYFRLEEWEAEVFNLAFGDWDEENNRINDLSISIMRIEKRYLQRLRRQLLILW